MEKLKGNIQTWIKILLLALLVIQIKAAFTQEFEMPSFVHAIDACDMDMDGMIWFMIFQIIGGY